MINTILSQQLGCGFYKSAVLHPYETFFSYINIPDTSGRDSLFQAEARRCKEIIDYVSTQKRTLCIFDELFSGTNPKEATDSTVSLLSYLAEYPAFTFLLTTHFTDVCEQLKHPSVYLYRMKTDVTPLTYHYRIERGISYVRGGHLVLKQMGFPDPILKHSSMCGELSK
jgi:DNA mismatch repair ATPase MutS